MYVQSKEIQNIQSRLDMYDKILEKILNKIEGMDKKKNIKKNLDQDEKIYLSIEGMNKALSLSNK